MNNPADIRSYHLTNLDQVERAKELECAHPEKYATSLPHRPLL